MNFYNPEFIRNFIEERKEIIYFAEVGLREDWIATHVPVFIHDTFDFDGIYDVVNESSGIYNVKGSSWATPVMTVYYTSGNCEIVECWKYGEKQVDKLIAKFKKLFASLKGRGDEK